MASTIEDVTIDGWERFGLTDTGLHRKQNEDHFLIAEMRKALCLQQTSLKDAHEQRLSSEPAGHLFVVADGMGGHARGRRASARAVEMVGEYVVNIMPVYPRLDASRDKEIRRELKTALRVGDLMLREESRGSQSQKRPMGTTLTMAYVVWPVLYTAHVGDSRAYMLRKGKLRRLTKDHTVAQDLLDRGAITAEQAERFRGGQSLWNVVGGGSKTLEPEIQRWRLQTGDGLILCSDGLNKVLDDRAIAATVKASESSRGACRRLVRRAIQGGGPDNITVIVARHVGPEGRKRRRRTTTTRRVREESAEKAGSPEPAQPAQPAEPAEPAQSPEPGESPESAEWAE